MLVITIYSIYICIVKNNNEFRERKEEKISKRTNFGHLAKKKKSKYEVKHTATTSVSTSSSPANIKQRSKNKSFFKFLFTFSKWEPLIKFELSVSLNCV